MELWRRRTRWFGILLAGGLCAAASAASDGVPAGRLIAVGGGPGGVAAACFSCHGLKGEGDAGGAFPRLAGLDARYLAKQLEDYATGRRPNEVMTPIASALSAEGRQNVSLYYASLPPAAASGSQRDPLLLQHGAVLWARGSTERSIQACAACHGPGGRGLGYVYPALAGQPAPYVAGQLRLWRDGVRGNDIASVMANVAKRMTDRDIEAAAAYVAELQP